MDDDGFGGESGGNVGGEFMAEFEAGPDQTVAVYTPEDVANELDPLAIFAEIAADATERATSGMRIVSMTSMPLRHAGAMFGNDGSGYQTKVAIAVVYERTARVEG